MVNKLYNREYVDSIAAKTGFIKDNVEKVLRLIDLLEAINTFPEFAGKFALKGGTAINLCIVDCPRLSVDIDLDYAENLPKEEMAAVRTQLKANLIDYIQDNGYKLSEKPRGHFALDSLLLSYLATSGNKDNIKLEINYIDRAHILPLEMREVKTALADHNIKALTLNPIEIYASKAVALFSRATPRDLYDVYTMLEKDVLSDYDLFRKCFIFYNMVGGEQDTDTLNYDKLDKYSYNDIKRYLKPVIKKDDIFDYKRAVEFVKAKMRTLLVPANSEMEFIQAFRCKDYRPDLLFDDKTIMERISAHPMAMWRTREN